MSETPDLFKDIIPALNETKEHLIREGKLQPKDFPAFIIMKYYALSMDTVLLANEINKYPAMSKSMQYDFWHHLIPPGKRKQFFPKKTERDINIEAIMEFYKCSYRVARQYEKILTEEQIKTIEKRVFKGEQSKHRGSI